MCPKLAIATSVFVRKPAIGWRPWRDRNRAYVLNIAHLHFRFARQVSKRMRPLIYGRQSSRPWPSLYQCLATVRPFYAPGHAAIASTAHGSFNAIDAVWKGLSLPSRGPYARPPRVSSSLLSAPGGQGMCVLFSPTAHCVASVRGLCSTNLIRGRTCLEARCAMKLLHRIVE